MAAIKQSAILLVALFSITAADYECLCNYHVERAVYPDMTDQDKPLGHLYEFDCKPTYWSRTPGNWQTIQFEHKVGYVAIDVQIKLQTCPGDLPIKDAIQMTSTSKTTSVESLSTTMPDSTATTSGTAYSIHSTLSSSTPAAKPSSAFVSSTILPSSKIRSLSSTSPLTTTATSLSPSSKTSSMVSKSTLKISTILSVSASPKQLSSNTLFNTTLSHYITTPKQSTIQSSSVHSESLQTQSKTAHLQTALTQSKLNPLQTMPTQSESTPLQSMTRHSKTTSKQTTSTQQKPTQIQSSLIQSKTTPIQTTPTQSKTTHLRATWTISDTTPLQNTSTQSVKTPLQTTLTQSVITPLQTTSTQSVATPLQTTSTQSVTTPLQTTSTQSVASLSNSTPTLVHKTISTLLPTSSNISSLSTKSFPTVPVTLIPTDRPSTSVLTALPTLIGSSATDMFTETTRSPTTRAPQCPPHLTRSQYLKEFGSHCYEFILGRSKQWQPAEDDCRDKAGHLVTIRNDAEQNFIYHTLRSLNFHGDNGVWIGLTDKDKEGHWRWSSGEKVTFTSWSDHQPGLLFALEDCALFDMRHHGHWDDYKCKGIIHNHQRHPWICEYNKL